MEVSGAAEGKSSCQPVPVCSLLCTYLRVLLVLHPTPQGSGDEGENEKDERKRLGESL